MQKKNVVLLFTLAFIGIAVASYTYIYKGHRNIEVSQADFKTTAEALGNEFSVDFDKASQKYLNKVILISGELSEKDMESVTLGTTILCYLDGLDANIQIATEVTIKGRCIGYDELLEVVKLDQCSLIE
ncbi:OB-fold protein [Flavicella sediminum]|uniref:OB-fold protein n=1 Tax=Flavicella sediminum TaxID=2585141 RepID=UPI0011242879|nr:hypothetical protein [Flavicella sediminum]